MEKVDVAHFDLNFLNGLYSLDVKVVDSIYYQFLLGTLLYNLLQEPGLPDAFCAPNSDDSSTLFLNTV